MGSRCQASYGIPVHAMLVQPMTSWFRHQHQLQPSQKRPLDLHSFAAANPALERASTSSDNAAPTVFAAMIVSSVTTERHFVCHFLH